MHSCKATEWSTAQPDRANDRTRSLIAAPATKVAWKAVFNDAHLFVRPWRDNRCSETNNLRGKGPSVPGALRGDSQRCNGDRDLMSRAGAAEPAQLLIQYLRKPIWVVVENRDVPDFTGADATLVSAAVCRISWLLDRTEGTWM